MPSSKVSNGAGQDVGIYERLAILDGKISAAHSRVDKIEILIREDLAEVKKDLKIVVAWMNRSLGWAAAFLFVGGVLGSLITKLIK